MKILAIGDCHACWPVLDSVLETLESTNPDIIVQVGDFGYYPRTNFLSGYVPKVPAYFIRGNHEYHASFPLDQRGPLTLPWSEPWIWLPEGERMANVLYIGGASSVPWDRDHRKAAGPGILDPWTPDEDPKNIADILEDLEDLSKPAPDIIIAHDIPLSITQNVHKGQAFTLPSARALEMVYQAAKARNPQGLWVAGHHHLTFQGDDDGWRCLILDQITSTKKGAGIAALIDTETRGYTLFRLS